MENYYDEATNSVLVNGTLEPINPLTGNIWSDADEANAYLAALPIPVAPVTPTVVIIGVTGTDVVYDADLNEVHADEGTVLTIDAEIQSDGVAIPEMDRDFFLAIDKDGQRGVKVIKSTFLDGVGQFVTTLPTGEFFVTEDTVNRRLTSEEHIAMPKPLQFVIAEVIA